MGFLGGSDGKESPCNAGELDSIPELGRYFGEENDYPLQYSCLENPMDRGAYSPWGRKEPDMTEVTKPSGLLPEGEGMGSAILCFPPDSIMFSRSADCMN